MKRRVKHRGRGRPSIYAQSDVTVRVRIPAQAATWLQRQAVANGRSLAAQVRFVLSRLAAGRSR